MGKNHLLRDKSKKFRHQHLAKKVLMWEFQGGICGCCGHEIIHPTHSRLHEVHIKDRPSEEHVWPISKFPRRKSWGNIMLSHWKCNSKKQDRLPTGCEVIWLAVVNIKYADYKRIQTNAARRRARAKAKAGGRRPNNPYARGLTDEELTAIFLNPVRRKKEVDCPV